MCHEPGSSEGPAYSFAYETSHLPSRAIC